MSQDKRMVALFVHACWLLRCGCDEAVGALVESDIEIESDELLEVPLEEVIHS